ncbi:hypothetical protein C1H46_015002 [Malus baccata]|uniref:Uncharacterized protein n=1 Tax=Malus baccata TaxID=106549 RepID=A0A540MKN4_MALBA|nr:hypothetical protein C1H46_015002 [Malus baccata]
MNINDESKASQPSLMAFARRQEGVRHFVFFVKCQLNELALRTFAGLLFLLGDKYPTSCNADIG